MGHRPPFMAPHHGLSSSRTSSPSWEMNPSRQRLRSASMAAESASSRKITPLELQNSLKAVVGRMSSTYSPGSPMEKSNSTKPSSRMRRIHTYLSLVMSATPPDRSRGSTLLSCFIASSTTQGYWERPYADAMPSL